MKQASEHRSDRWLPVAFNGTCFTKIYFKLCLWVFNNFLHTTVTRQMRSTLFQYLTVHARNQVEMDRVHPHTHSPVCHYQQIQCTTMSHSRSENHYIIFH